MKNLMRFWRRGFWTASYAATPWAQKALAAAYIRQLRLNLILQWPAMGMVVALFWGHFPLWQIALWAGCFVLALTTAQYRYAKNAGKILNLDRAGRILKYAPRRASSASLNPIENGFP